MSFTSTPNPPRIIRVLGELGSLLEQFLGLTVARLGRAVALVLGGGLGPILGVDGLRERREPVQGAEVVDHVEQPKLGGLGEVVVVGPLGFQLLLESGQVSGELALDLRGWQIQRGELLVSAGEFARLIWPTSII